MSSRTLLRSKVLLFALAGVLTALLAFHLTTLQRGITSARSLLSDWNLQEAEHELRSLVDDYPTSLAARQMYAECLLKRGELRGARAEFAALVRLDSVGALSHMLSLAFTHFLLGNLDTTSQLARTVMSRAGTDPSMMSRALHILGRVAFNRAQYDSAMSLQRRSLGLARASGSMQCEADALRQIGVLYWYNGKPDSARSAYYEPALQLYKQIGDKIGEATTLNNVGLLGDGMKYYLDAFALRKKIGDQVGLSDSYYFVTSGNLSHWFDLMYSFRRKSLALSRRIGYKWGEDVAARAVEDMAVSAYDSLRFDPDVIDLNDGAVGEETIQRMMRKSSALARNGKWKEAAALHERIMAMSDSMGYSIGLGQSLAHYVAALLPLGEYRKAERVARRLQGVWAGLPLEAGCVLAEVHLAAGEYGKAAELLTSLTSRLDAEYLDRLGRKDVGFSLASTQMLTLRYALFSMLMTALKQSGDRAKVFEAFERFRSLPLGFAIEQGNASATGGGESIWHRYVRTLEEMEKGSDDPERLMKEFDDDYRLAQEQSAASSGISQRLYGQSIPALMDVQRALTDNQMLLEYFVGKEEAYVFALRRDTSLFLPLPAHAANVNSSARALRDLLLRGATSREDGWWKGPARFLFRTLVQPVADHGLLKEGDHLIFSPHGRLYEVPYACLIDSGGRLLIERFTVSYVPTASSVLARPGTSGPTAFLGFVPDTKSLPFAEKEVAAIPTGLFSSRNLLLDDRATTSEFVRQAGNCAVLHIAAHGNMHRWHPLFSRLQFSDGPLELHRILNLKLIADLVVLSACETGYGVGMMGDVAQGHEVVSFPRAFLAAGVSSVVAPLWVVEDEATSLFMSSFYSHLSSFKRSDGSFQVGSFASSLTLAQRQFTRDLPKNPGKEHPFYWAGFCLVGSPN